MGFYGALDKLLRVHPVDRAVCRYRILERFWIIPHHVPPETVLVERATDARRPRRAGATPWTTTLCPPIFLFDAGTRHADLLCPNDLACAVSVAIAFLVGARPTVATTAKHTRRLFFKNCFNRSADVRAKTIFNRIVAVFMRKEQKGGCYCSLRHGVISQGAPAADLRVLVYPEITPFSNFHQTHDTTQAQLGNSEILKTKPVP